MRRMQQPDGPLTGPRNGDLQHGYGRTARHDNIAAAFRRIVLFLAGIPSSREPVGLMLGSLDQPVDIFVPSEEGCTHDADHSYSSAPLNLRYSGFILMVTTPAQP